MVFGHFPIGWAFTKIVLLPFYVHFYLWFQLILWLSCSKFFPTGQANLSMVIISIWFLPLLNISHCRIYPFPRLFPPTHSNVFPPSQPPQIGHWSRHSSRPIVHFSKIFCTWISILKFKGFLENNICYTVL